MSVFRPIPKVEHFYEAQMTNHFGLIISPARRDFDKVCFGCLTVLDQCSECPAGHYTRGLRKSWLVSSSPTRSFIRSRVAIAKKRWTRAGNVER